MSRFIKMIPGYKSAIIWLHKKGICKGEDTVM